METRNHIELKRGETRFHLWRLTVEEYRQLLDTSLPIKEDSLFFAHLILCERHNPDRLTLPKAFLTLEFLFGKTSTWIDTWKGSFSFPLLLLVQKPTGQFFYLMEIYDHRGGLCYPLRRILENGADSYNATVCREPFELEFSREEINEFISYLYGYLVGVSESVCKLSLQPFLKHIDSNHILYGYRDGEFFEEEIASQEEYKAAIQEFEETYASIMIEEKSDKVKLLLQQITGKVL